MERVGGKAWLEVLDIPGLDLRPSRFGGAAFPRKPRTLRHANALVIFALRATHKVKHPLSSSHAALPGHTCFSPNISGNVCAPMTRGWQSSEQAACVPNWKFSFGRPFPATPDQGINTMNPVCARARCSCCSSPAMARRCSTWLSPTVVGMARPQTQRKRRDGTGRRQAEDM